jgi:hypothetical protein
LSALNDNPWHISSLQRVSIRAEEWAPEGGHNL